MRPDRGVFVAADVHYLVSGGARAAAVVCADAGFSRLVADRVELVPRVEPYRPGEFYLRELPPLRALLDRAHRSSRPGDAWRGSSGAPPDGVSLARVVRRSSGLAR